MFVGAAVGLVGTAFREAARRGYELFGGMLGAADARGIPGWVAGAAGGAVLVVLSAFLTRRFAGESAGSGIQEVEGILAGTLPPIRWRRVLPVKFFGGLFALSAGLLLGREGPTIHMGAGIASAVAERSRASRERLHLLLGAGAAAGLAVAFRAPLAGILFALEELRREFPPTRQAIRAVALATITAVLVGIALTGRSPLLPVAAARSPTALELGLVIPVRDARGRPRPRLQRRARRQRSTGPAPLARRGGALPLALARRAPESARSRGSPRRSPGAARTSRSG